MRLSWRHLRGDLDARLAVRLQLGASGEQRLSLGVDLAELALDLCHHLTWPSHDFTRVWVLPCGIGNLVSVVGSESIFATDMLLNKHAPNQTRS